MTREQLFWVVGVVESEGSMFMRGKRPCVQVSMTDEDVVRRLAKWSQVGKVYGPYQRKAQPWTKPYWIWVVLGPEASGLMLSMMPILGERRWAKAKEVMGL